MDASANPFGTTDGSSDDAHRESEWAAGVCQLSQWRALVRETVVDPGPLSLVVSELAIFLFRMRKQLLSSSVLSN